ncbi:deoxynucleoside kinase [Mariprofundus erugo]|uniref:deoxynucleoside kinase n=1 Tax=Mariprofundus erugo TaxID=2528639 RepID=UPI0013757582|nr:deoxynucleoside kinase [Mariprofundus erugo]
MFGGKRIEVCGGIASGKTTLAGLFSDDVYLPVYENFQANPFWQAFYQNPDKFAFETEITFLLQHYHQITAAQSDNKVIVTDYSFVLDRAYVDVTLNEGAKDAFLSVYGEVMRRLGPPALLVYLNCSPEIELGRVRDRGRGVESGITVEYLVAMNRAISDHMERASSEVRVLIIDSEYRDFAHDKLVQQSVLAEINQALHGA